METIATTIDNIYGLTEEQEEELRDTGSVCVHGITYVRVYESYPELLD